MFLLNFHGSIQSFLSCSLDPFGVNSFINTPKEGSSGFPCFRDFYRNESQMHDLSFKGSVHCFGDANKINKGKFDCLNSLEDCGL